MNEIFTYFAIVFRSPERLWIILPVALLFVGLLFVKYRAACAALKKRWIQEHLLRSRIPSLGAYVSGGAALILGAALLAGVWAEPERKVTKPEPVYGKVRMTFLFDSSRSMAYGEDVLPSRLAAAKKTVAEFVDALRVDAELKGQYELALIPFAGGAIHSYAPFTTSYDEFLWLLENINENTVSHQGTSFLAAIEAYGMLLERSPARETGAMDLAIIISDGGKEEGIQSERNLLESAVKKLGSSVIISAVGIGSKERDEACFAKRKKEGASFPQSACLRGTKPVRLVVRDADGVFVDYFRKEPGGMALFSELDESMLKFLATWTREDTPSAKRNYHFFTDTEEILAAFKSLVVRYRIQVATADYYQYEPVIAWFLVPAFLIFFFFLGFGGWVTHFAAILLKRLR